MTDAQRQPPADAEGQPSGAQPHAGGPGQPSEEELRAAYEAELSRITSAEMILQTAVSLLNLGGHRLGLAGGEQAQRDLEQVRDAIDGVRGLMPVLERRMPNEIRPLRDALAQLQMAFARETAPKPADEAPEPEAPEPDKPGPAQASGRLWVPGR